VISKIFYNGPAWKAGAKVKDLILEIDGASTGSVQMNDVLTALRGDAKSIVRMLVRQPDAKEKRELVVTRDRVFLPAVEGARLVSEGQWKYTIDDAPDVALIRLTGVGPSTLHELRQVESAMNGQSVRGIVLDLSLGGALLHDVVMVADALVDDAVIRHIQSLDGRKTHVARVAAMFGDIPMVVLTSRFASAGYVFLTAALQDSGRAVVVGERTPGNKYVKSLIDVPGRDEKITLATGVMHRADGTPLLVQQGSRFAAPVLKIEKAATLSKKRARFIMPDYEVSERPGVPGKQRENDAVLLKAIAVIREKIKAKSPEDSVSVKTTPASEQSMCNCYFAQMLAVILLMTTFADAADTLPRLRRPVALAVSPDLEWGYTANRDSGTVSVISVEDRSVSNELVVGQQLVDIAAWDASHPLVLDGVQHQLVLLRGRERHWKVVERLDVAPYPVRLCVDAESGRCFVTSLWSRTLTQVDVETRSSETSPQLQISATTSLDFEPRELCLTADRQRLLVAGSFRNSLVVVDVGVLEIASKKPLSGHNLRGMALSNDGESLLVTCQLLNPLGQSTRDGVHWGNMLSNVLIKYSVDELCESKAGARKSRVVRYPGEPGNAAGDPGFASVGQDGELAIALSGVGEMAISANSEEYRPQRVAVGRRPVAIARIGKDSLFVADMFSDSVSVVDSSTMTRTAQISLGPQPELSIEQSGEALFYDSRLSHDGWMSCHSCHTDGHTSGQFNDNLSDGTFGDPKRVLSLLGVSDTGPWAWNGQVRTLDEQVTNSIEKTMQGTTAKESDVSALVAYLKSLSSLPRRESSNDVPIATLVERGERLFETLDCKRCHTPPTYTSAETYDVGLGGGKFNPPSLRGVGYRNSLFHDSRADSLSAVLVRYKHRLPRDLTVEEVRALVSFLKTL